jgi:hypothetical protein
MGPLQESTAQCCQGNTVRNLLPLDSAFIKKKNHYTV